MYSLNLILNYKFHISPNRYKRRQPPSQTGAPITVWKRVRVAVESEIKKLVGADIAPSSTSPCASPIVMVRKKHGGWQMCIDYRRLNSITKFDCFLLPPLDETFDAFSGATVFSSLNLAIAYN